MKIAHRKRQSLNLSYKVIYALLILLLSSTLLFSQSEIDKYFTLEREITIDRLSVHPPLRNCSDVTMTKEGSIFMGLNPSQRIAKFNEQGDFQLAFGGKEIDGKLKIEDLSEIVYNEQKDRLLVADWLAKRVLSFNKDGELMNSFFANADNLRNVTDIALWKNKIIVGGPALVYEPTDDYVEWEGKYLHLFSRKGKHLQSLFDAYPQMIEDNRFRTNSTKFAILKDKVYALQTSHYLISLFDEDVNRVKKFGEKPKNWKSVSYSKSSSSKKFWDNNKQSLIKRFFTINDRLIYVYYTADLENWRHLDKPRMCIYNSDGKLIANGLPLKYGYTPTDYFCTVAGVNSSNDRLYLLGLQIS